MSTKAILIIKENSNTLVTIYKHWDGYIKDGFGENIYNFLKDKKIVDSISNRDSEQFNGMGCLAASLIAHFKKGPGDVYIERNDLEDYGADYIYELNFEKNCLMFKCSDFFNLQIPSQDSENYFKNFNENV